MELNGSVGVGEARQETNIFFIQREMKLVKRKEHRITNGAPGGGVE